jgi:hypothetical protein
MVKGGSINSETCFFPKFDLSTNFRDKTGKSIVAT